MNKKLINDNSKNKNLEYYHIFYKNNSEKKISIFIHFKVRSGSTFPKSGSVDPRIHISTKYIN